MYPPKKSIVLLLVYPSLRSKFMTPSFFVHDLVLRLLLRG